MIGWGLDPNRMSPAGSGIVYLVSRNMNSSKAKNRLRKPLVVVSCARSGTNYFLDVYKAMFPEDVVLREIFREGGDSLFALKKLTGLPRSSIKELNRQQPQVLWDEVLSATRRKQTNLAFKVFYYHLPIDSPLWDTFAREARIVHLIRRNVLKSLVSRELAVLTGEWVRYEGNEKVKRKPRIAIAPEEAQRFIQKRISQVESFRDKLAGTDIHEIFYEDISGNVKSCSKAIAEIVGGSVPDTDVEIAIRKQNKRKNSEVIDNYHEVEFLDRLYFGGWETGA